MWREADPDIGYVKNVTTRVRRAPDPAIGVVDDDFFDFVSREGVPGPGPVSGSAGRSTGVR